MSLLVELNKIFENESDDRIRDIYKALKLLGVNNPYDLEYLDKDILSNVGLLKPIEIKKLLAATNGAKSLKKTLEEIFGNISPAKLEDIVKFFEGEEVYTAEDLALIDLEMIAGNKTTFRDIDVEKLRNYIRKNHADRFMEIKVKEDIKTNKENAQFKHGMDMEIWKAKSKSKEMKYLYSKQAQLLSERRDLSIKMAELMISQTSGRNENTFQNVMVPTGLDVATCMSKKAANIYGCAMAGTVVVKEILDIYSKHVTYSNDRQALEENLKIVNENMAEVGRDITVVSGRSGRNCLTSESGALAIKENQ